MRRSLCEAYGLEFLASAWFLRRFGPKVRSAGLSSWSSGFRVRRFGVVFRDVCKVVIVSGSAFLPGNFGFRAKL